MKRLTGYWGYLYRPDMGTMVCRWLGEVTPAEMRTSYKHLFAEAQGVGSRVWLLDIRRRNNDDPETAQWLLDEFLPMLTIHFGGPIFLAYLLSPAHLGRVDDAVNPMHVAQLHWSVHVGLFTDEEAANAWLVQQAGK